MLQNFACITYDLRQAQTHSGEMKSDLECVLNCSATRTVRMFTVSYFVERAGGIANALTESLMKSVMMCTPNIFRLGGKNVSCKKITKHYLSRLMTKPPKWHVCPAQTQISLGIHPVWSVFIVHTKKLRSLATHEHTAKSLIRLGICTSWSESSMGADHYVSFVMKWLIWALS